MKVALDVDGVITEAPVFFAYLTSALRNSGHEVHIISDFDEHFREQRIEELRTYGVEYDHFEITRDKAEYCKSHAIDFALDDDAHEYFAGMCITTLGLVALDRCELVS